MESADLYRLRDTVLVSLHRMNDPQLAAAKLCGGAALSRCWLSHRVSYDLDFFLPEGFNAGRLAVALKRAGIDFEAKDLVDGLDKANQLHGYVLLNGQRLKVSFMEDAYFSLFPVQQAAMGTGTVRTEAVQGLYHRKLRTVSGHAAQGDSFEGGRQKARDLFDLYVLSQRVMPIRPFMASLPYAFPSAVFDNGLASMPWFELMDELAEIICDPQWNQAKSVDFLQNALYAQIGALLIVDGSNDGEATHADTWRTLSKKVFWDRDVALERWREQVATGHSSYLPDSIATLTPVEFVRFYGLDNFKRDWPALRAALPQDTLKFASVFDVAWSHAVGGGWNLVPAADYYAMAAKRRAFLTEVARVPGKSIYEVAKNLGMQYRRAHDHASSLIEAGKIRPVDDVENGLRKRLLYPKRGLSI